MGKPIPPELLLNPTGAAPQAPQQTAPAAYTQQSNQSGAYPQATVISAPPSLNMNRPMVPPPPPPAASTSPQSANKQIPAPKLNFVSGSHLQSVGDVSNASFTSEPMQTSTQMEAENSNAADSDNIPNMNDGSFDDVDYSNLEPVGREYIETRLEGKILSFYCKLCECQFNDPNAKDMHTKGRRHRLAYKKKVDPSLRVDMKGSIRSKSVREKQPRLKPNQQRLRNTSVNNTNIINNNNNSNSIGGSMNSNVNIAPQTNSNIKPLMSSNLESSMPTTQTIQQLMAQPLK